MKTLLFILKALGVVIGLIMLSGAFIPFCPSGVHLDLFTCGPGVPLR